MFVWKDRHYRGKAVLHADGDIVLLVNVLPMEAYLQGVVPKEMMASWEENALCAQAVAARTYALYLCSKSQDKPYDVAATTASQVYGGADAGSPRTDAAVKGTRGTCSCSTVFRRCPTFILTVAECLRIQLRSGPLACPIIGYSRIISRRIFIP